jgi:predicted nucleic acid-binding protein
MLRPVVIDTSFGVKWFRAEDGTDEADELLERHGANDVQICMPSHVLHEILGVVRRQLGTDVVVDAHDRLAQADLLVWQLDGELLKAAVRECEELNCSFYDSLAPALAALLSAPLYSADRRAHSTYADVVLIG